MLLLPANCLTNSLVLDIEPLPSVLPTLLNIAAGVSSAPAVSVAQIVALVMALGFLLVSGFVSGSEIAFFSLTPAQCDHLDTTPQGATVRRLLEKPERLLATILISNNLVNVTIVVLCNFALGPVFANMSPVLSFILQTVILTFLILLFGEILPKIYCSNFPEKWARFAAAGLWGLERFFAPASRFLVGSTSIVNRVVTKKAQAVTTDDLSQALEITTGATKTDKDILEGILRYGETEASEIMTPRVDLTDLDMRMTFDEVMEVVICSGFSRLPVYEETEDNIRGILYARDLLPYIGAGHDREDFDWHRLLRPAYFVPESRRIDDLLEDFRSRKQHLAIVVDEYGGTQGIVTMEDVLEEIVGDIDDEYDTPDSTYRRLSNNTFIFEGKTPLTDFFRITGLEENDYAAVAEDSETLAGMLLNIKGDFPRDKEPLVYGCCRFLVLDVSDHRIVSVRVKVMEEPQES